MVKLADLLSKVAPNDPDRDRVRRAVLDTIAGLGFHVGPTGEVCDPRPAPTPEWDRQRNVRYPGMRGRRR